PLDLPAVLPDSRAVRQRSWIKRLLPTTMFGRSLLLIVVPLIIVQLVSAWAFYARHWETMSRRLSADVVGDIGVTIEAMQALTPGTDPTKLLEQASLTTEVSFSFAKDATLAPSTAADGSGAEEQLRIAVQNRLGAGAQTEMLNNSSDFLVQV